jgi:hypothetical protein
MPFAKQWMSLDIWQLVTSQDTQCTDEEYRLAEKIVLRIGPAYEWPRRAILTFAGAPSSLKHNCVAGQTMSRFAFAVWSIGNGCTAELLKEWVMTRKLINEPADQRNFSTLCENLVAGRITEVSGRPVTVSILASNQSRHQANIVWRECLGNCEYPGPGGWCEVCREGEYVKNHSRLTMTEFNMLDAPVQDYYKETCTKWGLDWSDLLTPIIVNLGDRMIGPKHLHSYARGI